MLFVDDINLPAKELYGAQVNKLGLRLAFGSRFIVCRWMQLHLLSCSLDGTPHVKCSYTPILQPPQPALELLRLLVDRRGLYDPKTLAWWPAAPLGLVAACGPPGGGRQPVSTRLTRHFAQLAMPPPGEAGVGRVCTAILGGFLEAHFTPGGRQTGHFAHLDLWQ